MSDQSLHNEGSQWLHTFASLSWYEETIAISALHLIDYRQVT